MPLEDVYRRNANHKTHRAGWLRAAVLGANDGLVSTASLMIGVSAARADNFLVTAGAAGIAAGAMSMAVGEYISVRSQNDIEESDRLLEIEHLAVDPAGELEELIEIYMNRGLNRELATEVAKAMTERDALEAHLRDELGQFPHTKARPSSGIDSFCPKFHSRWTYSIRWRTRANLGHEGFKHYWLYPRWTYRNWDIKRSNSRVFLPQNYDSHLDWWLSRHGNHRGNWLSGPPYRYLNSIIRGAIAILHL